MIKSKVIIMLFYISIIFLSSCSKGERYKAVVIKKTAMLSIPGKYETKKGEINRGENVIVLDEEVAKGGIWVKVKLAGEDKSVWIKKEDIIKGEAFPITITKRTVFMERPSYLSILKKILRVGDRGIAFVEKKIKGWIKVELSDNSIGWIPSNSFKKGYDPKITTKPTVIKGIGPVVITASNYIYPKEADKLYCFPEDAFDNNTQTAWLFSFGRKKATAWINIVLPKKTNIKISIINGISSNIEEYTKNKIIKRIKLILEREEVALFSEGTTTIKDKYHFVLKNNNPTFQPLGGYIGVKSIKIIILDFYDNRKTYGGIAEIKIEKF